MEEERQMGRTRLRCSAASLTFLLTALHSAGVATDCRVGVRLVGDVFRRRPAQDVEVRSCIPGSQYSAIVSEPECARLLRLIWGAGTGDSIHVCNRVLHHVHRPEGGAGMCDCGHAALRLRGGSAARPLDSISQKEESSPSSSVPTTSAGMWGATASLSESLKQQVPNSSVSCTLSGNLSPNRVLLHTLSEV